MNTIRITATFLIAAFAYLTGADAQNVYRCGASYSQVPCPEGTEVKVSDPRSAEQKKSSDARIQHDLGVANSMEKSRLKEEEQQRAERARQEAARVKAEAAATKASEAAASKAAAAQKAPAAKHHPKKKEPEYFTARSAPADKPKSGASAPGKP